MCRKATNRLLVWSSQKGQNPFMKKRKNWDTEFRHSVTYRMIRNMAGAGAARVAEKAVDTALHAADIALDATQESVQKVHRTVSNYSDSRYGGAPVYEANGTPPPQPQPVQTPHKPKKWKKGRPVPEGYRSVHHKSVVPIYAIGVFWLLWALLFPLSQVWHFLLAAVCSVAVYFVTSKIFKGKWELEKIPVAPKEPVSSGNPLVDQMVKDGTKYLRDLREANDKIEDEEISDAIDRMEDLTFKIFAYVCDHSDKAPQIRRFMNYYLPTTLKLLDSYYTLSQQGVQGENIMSAMHNIRAIMHTIVQAFEKQLDSLFGEEALDISTDITVLENMLQQEGLAGEQMPKAGQ